MGVMQVVFLLRALFACVLHSRDSRDVCSSFCSFEYKAQTSTGTERQSDARLDECLMFSSTQLQLQGNEALQQLNLEFSKKPPFARTSFKPQHLDLSVLAVLWRRNAVRVATTSTVQTHDGDHGLDARG